MVCTRSRAEISSVAQVFNISNTTYLEAHECWRTSTTLPTHSTVSATALLCFWCHQPSPLNHLQGHPTLRPFFDHQSSRCTKDDLLKVSTLRVNIIDRLSDRVDLCLNTADHLFNAVALPICLAELWSIAARALDRSLAGALPVCTFLPSGSTVRMSSSIVSVILIFRVCRRV